MEWYFDSAGAVIAVIAIAHFFAVSSVMKNGDKLPEKNTAPLPKHFMITEIVKNAIGSGSGSEM